MQILKPLLCSCLLINWLNCAAQIRIEKLSLIDTTQNEMFVGMPNRLRIHGLGEEDRVFLGTIGPIDRQESVCNFRPLAGAAPDTLWVIRGARKIPAAVFRLQRLEEPALYIGSLKMRSKDNKASRSQLLDALRLAVKMGNYKPPSTIVSFELATVTKGVYRGFEISSDDALSMDQRTAIAQLQPGDQVYIDNLRVRLADGAIRQLHPVSLAIVE